MAGKRSGSDAGAAGLEKRLARLEQIVAALEREDLELEEALRLFEEGVGHLREAQETIRSAELRIDRLVEGATGGVVIDRLPSGEEP